MSSYSSDNDGKFIPASQRPDGTWRKARRVKDGYVPQEEVPLYESKGKQFLAKQSDVPVGMCPIAAKAAKEKKQKQQKKSNASTVPGLIVLPKTNSNPKTKTNKQTANEQKETSKPKSIPVIENVIENLTENLENVEIDENQEITKQLRKLKKKVREIEAIEDKIKSGELKKPDKDQMEKVKKKKDFLTEIKDLEKQMI